MEIYIYLNMYVARYTARQMEMQTKGYIDGQRNMQKDSWKYIGR